MIAKKPETGSALDNIIENLGQTPETQAFADRLKAALKDDLPVMERDGGFIREGYSPELDKFSILRSESKRLIAALQSKYKDISGIDALKISFNNVLGYFIEVPSKKADALLIRKGEESTPDNPFIHRQTMASAVRFTTGELAELERDISQASEKAVGIELELFAGMVQAVSGLSAEIGRHARALAALDVAGGLAALASELDYCRPHIDNSLAFDIKEAVTLLLRPPCAPKAMMPLCPMIALWMTASGFGF